MESIPKTMHVILVMNHAKHAMAMTNVQHARTQMNSSIPMANVRNAMTNVQHARTFQTNVNHVLLVSFLFMTMRNQKHFKTV
mgnify:CR=1 FL=1